MNICIVNCFDTYEHRVDLLLDSFRSQGHKAFVLASDFRHIDKVKRNEKKKGFLFFHAKPYYKNMSVQRMVSHNCLSRDIAHFIDRHIDNIDLIWALIPPNSLVKELAVIKKKDPRVKLIFDLIDLWPETMPVGKVKNVFPFTYWRDLRDEHLSSADHIVTECRLYQKKLEGVLQGCKVDTLYLARPYVEYIPNLHLPNDKIALCYLGSINNIIDIDTIIRLVKQFQMIKPVELHIIGDGEKRAEFIAKVKKTGAKVIYHGKVYDREEKQYIFDGCHYGLNIMKSSVCVGLTMKSMDYFEFGLPIINNIHGDTWEIIKSKHIGFNYSKVGFVGSDFSYDLLCRNDSRCFYEERLTFTAFDNKIKKIMNFLK